MLILHTLANTLFRAISLGHANDPLGIKLLGLCLQNDAHSFVKLTLQDLVFEKQN